MQVQLTAMAALLGTAPGEPGASAEATGEAGADTDEFGRPRRRREATPQELPPFGFLVARFVARYGAAAYYDPRRYDTRDGVIPWPQFVALLQALPRLAMADMLSVATGVKLGYLDARTPRDKGFRLQFHLKRARRYADGIGGEE